MCPALIQQIVSGACQAEDDHESSGGSKSDAQYTTAMSKDFQISRIRDSCGSCSRIAFIMYFFQNMDMEQRRFL